MFALLRGELSIVTGAESGLLLSPLRRGGGGGGGGGGDEFDKREGRKGEDEEEGRGDQEELMRLVHWP